MCCSVLQFVAVWCSVLQCVACCSVLQHVAVCCSVLQCGIVCCNVSRVAVRRSALVDDARTAYDEALALGDLSMCCSLSQYVAECCCVLQCVAMCCMMQCVAVRRSVLVIDARAA